MLRNVNFLMYFFHFSLPCICVIISHLCIYVMTMSCICLSRNKIMLCYIMIFPSFRRMVMVGEACLPSNAYYPRTPDYNLCSGVHVCWSEHSDSSFVYGFMSLDYGFGTMTATTSLPPCLCVIKCLPMSRTC